LKHPCDSRQAAQLYAAWREGSRVVRERILQEPELYVKTQRPLEVEPNPSAAEMERDLDMAVALLQRVGRRLNAALSEMDAPQQEQVRGRIERARREMNRINERMQQQQENKHADLGATQRDSGNECAANQPARAAPEITAVPEMRFQTRAHIDPFIEKTEPAYLRTSSMHRRPPTQFELSALVVSPASALQVR